MKILVILAHPNTQSFNAAIAKTAVTVLTQLGHDVCFSDLYRDGFSPLINTAEISSRSMPADAMIKRHCAWVQNADGFVIVHPNWWGQPPAILKGWIDRVIRPEVAYRFNEGDSGQGVPIGLLKSTASAVVFNTTDTDPVREKEVFGDPLEVIWKNCIFSFCGVTDFTRQNFGIVVTSTLQQRLQWLEKVKELLTSKFAE